MSVPKDLTIKKLKDKSGSQRLRAVIFRYWQFSRPQDQEDMFQKFYDAHINAIIEQYKKKLGGGDAT